MNEEVLLLNEIECVIDLLERKDGVLKFQGLSRLNEVIGVVFVKFFGHELLQFFVFGNFFELVQHQLGKSNELLLKRGGVIDERELIRMNATSHFFVF